MEKLLLTTYYVIESELIVREITKNELLGLNIEQREHLLFTLNVDDIVMIAEKKWHNIETWRDIVRATFFNEK